MEYWSKTHNFRVWIKAFYVTHYQPYNAVFPSARNHPLLFVSASSGRRQYPSEMFHEMLWEDPMNHITVQPHGTRIYPIFHHSINPLFSAFGG
jgi:hypothetical protein